MPEAMFYNALQRHTESDYRRLKRLREKFGLWEKAWRETAATENAALDPEKEWQKLEARHVNLILFEDEHYPKLLREIPWPPFGIYAKGTLSHDDALRLAIVGTRKATREGTEFAGRIAGELTSRGIEIVSGLAFGVDAAAHRGALERDGTTIAVLAHGLDRVYPRSHETIAKDIVRHGGALLSEYPLESPSYPSRFIERNRIVSGLSRGVIIVEAPRESGALATARFASEQNREVMVVPGQASHPNFAGSHELIRSGAALVTTAAHILEAFGLSPPPEAQTTLFATTEEKAILEALTREGRPLPIDKLIELTNLKANVVSQAVSFLLIKGTIRETERGYTIA